MSKFKLFFNKLLSYIKPVQLGMHASCDPVTSNNALESDTLLQIVEQEVLKALESKTKNKSTNIKLDDKIKASLKNNSGDFIILSISIGNKSNSTMVKLQQMKTGKILKVSMNTFRMFFNLKNS